MRTPKPGDIGFSTPKGAIGSLIGFLQWAQSGGGSRYAHCFILLDNNEILEAKPKGARITPLINKGQCIFFDPGLNEEQRAQVVAESRKYVGVKYSFMDYIGLGFAKYGKYPVKLFSYLSASNKFICSTLVDTIYNNCGVKLFTDGRSSYAISPADILFNLLEKDWLPEPLDNVLP